MQYKRVPLARLQEAVVLASGVRDEEGRLLLGAGITLTQDGLTALHKRGIRTVLVTDEVWRRLSALTSQGKGRTALPNRTTVTSGVHCETTRALDSQLDELAPCEIVSSDNPFSAKVKPRGAEPYCARSVAEAVEGRRQAVDQVRQLLEGLGWNEWTGVETLAKLSRDSLMRAADDLDLFVCMGTKRSSASETGSVPSHGFGSAAMRAW